MAIQILRGTSATISETFTVDGAAADLDSGVPVVTITKPDGTTISSGTVTHVGAGGSGTYQFLLAAQAEVTLLDITWVGTIGGDQQTLNSQVEVIGAQLFTLAALRAVKVAGSTPFADQVAYPDQTLLDRRAEVTDDFERRCGWSFVPRFARETLHGTGRCELLLEQRRASRLLSVTINGTTQLSGFTLSQAGVLYSTSNFLPAGWIQYGLNNVVVEYVHGFDRPPATISSAGLARTAMLLAPSQAGSTVSSWTTPDGTTYSYDQAGQTFAGGGVRHYGVPAIDAALNAYTALGAFA